ncbi:MAG: tetratricopeptide repeat protein [Sedimentisphaerales bacterium]|nr:tetratricopeptide repeat protein [Sedimentisphaerales bacterium]
MAKKLNKKIAYSLLTLLVVCIAGGSVVGLRMWRERNPEYSLEKARSAFKNQDFQTAEQFFGKAYAYTKLDEDKIDILFEMAEFHLTSSDQHEPNWRKALGCWQTVLNVNPNHIEARRRLMDYYYQMADSGGSGAWKWVEDHSSKLLEVFEKTKKEPDISVLMANARASLEIARVGTSAFREDLVTKAITDLEALKKKTPDNASIYEYLIEATLLKGELDYLKGVAELKDNTSAFALKTAREKAQEDVKQIIEQAKENASDKSLANAFALEMRVREAQSDPNLLPDVRKEAQALAAAFPDSDRIHAIVSTTYELHGAMDRRQELNLAIQNIEKALSLATDKKVAHAMRLASLLYRTGSFYGEKELALRAINEAEQALTYPESTVLPGPKESAARQNRLMIQIFLARCYSEQTLLARENQDAASEKAYLTKTRNTVSGITQAVGENNLLAKQWQGMQLLAEGQTDQAFRSLYSIYQEYKSLDKAGDYSTIDAHLCYVLSRIAAQQRSIGMQREFLEKALYNQNSIAPEKPGAILDYASVLLELQGGAPAANIIRSYLNIYGKTPNVQIMLANAMIQTGQFEQVDAILNELDPDNLQTLLTRLMSLTLQVSRLQGQINLAGSAGATPALKAQLTNLRTQQGEFIKRLMEKAPNKLESGILASYCRYAMANDIKGTAELVDQYLVTFPTNTTAQLLKLELAEPDPKAVTSSRRTELLEQVLLQTQDPLRRALGLGQHYRSVGKNDLAKEHYQKAYDLAPDNIEVCSGYFRFLLDQKDIKTAESIYQKIRDKNPDGCEGNLFAAQLEIARENYTTALRRLDECLALRPSLTTAAILKSQVYLQQKNYTAAVENATKAYQMDPQNGVAARQLASTLFERNRDLGSKVTDQQLAEADRAVGLAMVLNPGEWQLQSVYAETLSQQDPQRALAMRQVLLKNNPNTTNAIMLGNMAMRQSQDEKDESHRNALLEIAGNAYEQAWKMAPSDTAIQTAYAEYLRVTSQRQKAVEIFAENKEVLWRFYMSDSQYVKALEILEALNQKTPDQMDILQGLVEAHQGLNQWDAMKTYLDILAQKELTVDQELWLIQKYLDSGHNQPAEVKLASFQERHPDDTRGLLLDAWLEMMRGNLEVSLTKTQRYLEQDTNSAGGWRLKGRIHRLMNQPQQAIDALQRSKSITPDSSVRMELATLYSQSKQIEAAAGELNTGLNDPKAPQQLRLMLETLYRENKRYTDLRTFYTKTLEQFPEDPFWTNRAGLFYLEQKDYAAALKLLETSLNLNEKNGINDAAALDNYLSALIAAQKLDNVTSVAAKYIDGPLAPVAYWNIATVQAKMNQPEKATESFTRAIEKTGDNPASLLATLSVMERVLGANYVETWCTQKLTAEPKFIPAHLMLVNLAEKAEAFNKALTHIDQCLENAPQNSMQWLEFSNRKANILMQAYAKTADANYLKQALSQLEANLKLRPNDETMMNNIAYLMADNDIDLDKAVSYARRAHQKLPGNAIFLDTYAYALCKSGEYAQAETYMRQVIASYERINAVPPWDVYKHLGMALAGQKKNKEALVAFEKANELGIDIPDKEKQYLQKTIQSLKL